jgi:hypothetical protein
MRARALESRASLVPSGPAGALPLPILVPLLGLIGTLVLVLLGPFGLVSKSVCTNSGVAILTRLYPHFSTTLV